MPGKNLTRDEAMERSQLIATHSYEVTTDVTTGPSTFATRSVVRFTALGAGDTFIDFIGDRVTRATLDGAALDTSRFDGARLPVPGLTEGEHELVVEGVGRYMNTGEGLHRFVDPADGEVYLYTQFEVADCRRMFPVFEQPDLKATFQFTITAPAHWQVLSNEATPQGVPAGTGTLDGENPVERATFTFEPTPPISCYITAVVAGPYVRFEDSVETRNGTVPLGVLARRSLEQHLDADNVFAITKAGFAFFEEYFDQPYPFRTYDQVFTPEYNMGAMENAGCVTFAEIYVFRSAVPDTLVERRALTILHELAHMWFGNLVTMKWWNDLWLNESFAEWASTTCQTEATQWDTAWTTFAISEKTWAYHQDQLSSTHPIVAEIRDLADVEVNFDGITYAKGASVLKQLVAYVGEDAFRDGLRAYFAEHKWGNTTLADLTRHLEATSGRDLGPWVAAWLETAGVNTLSPVLEVDDAGTVTAAAIEQKATAELPTLRPHRIAVGAYDLVDGSLQRTDRWELDVTGERTELPQLVGRARPDLLLLNDDDLGYCKVRLDAHSLATATEHVAAFTDSLPRAVVLGAAWDMTRDAQMSARDFIELGLRALPGETDSTLVRILLSQLEAAAGRYVAPQHREATAQRLADELGRLVEQAAPGSDLQLQLATAWAAAVRGEAGVARLRALVDGTTELPGLTVDTDMRWALVTGLAKNGVLDEDELAAEGARDRTASGAERLARARAARPDAASKQAAWDSVWRDTRLPNAEVVATAAGWQRARTPEDLRPFVEPYFEAVADMWDERTHAIAEAVAGGFYPHPLVHQDLVDAAQAWLDGHPDASAALRRVIAENRDGTVRALAAQAFDARS
ncbi:aminopeptidase N [Kytococcus schroeteri]|uniref:Aminopeptidase N n=2 Tax=Kytococcus TaxID=57499 RepID=A0A2I1P9H4_9MICO|nr:aminopeptidase N [Kytococcus schroeteri]PKZ41286.1 aminopeptidase N [Kytococcus schroeteri]